MTAFVADSGAAVPVDLRPCDVCGGPYFAGSPGTAPTVHPETGIILSAGEAERAWCAEHWPWRKCRGPWQPSLFDEAAVANSGGKR